MRIVRLVSVLASLAPLLAVSTPPAGADGPAFHELWRQGDEHGWERWTLADVRVADGRLVLDPSTPVARGPGVAGPADGAGASDRPPALHVGTAIGPERETGERFVDLIPSWNAETPPDP